jgi:hypothetical protein
MRHVTSWIAPVGSWVAVITALILGAAAAQAHCDGMDGPVVAAARRALATGNVAHALVWVQEADDGEVRQAFERTMAVRKLGPEAKELADYDFFEAVVRIHRAGEGAPYTGLKPAGRDLGPAIPAADRALDSGSVEPVERLLTVVSGLRKRFREVVEAKTHAAHDLKAGRRYVRAYVSFVHYVERLHEAAQTPPHGHFAEDQHAPSAAYVDDDAGEPLRQEKRP